MNTTPAVCADGLGKRYGELWALRDFDLELRPGQVVGLLGPNGAGKTTSVRILTTLLAPDEGRASVAGFDVAEQSQRVREHIGLAGQAATVDELLTGRANLEMVGRLYHLPRAYVRHRAGELLERMSLADVADKQARTYSGGMRRRLDLAASLLASPPACFLDEPTTGLDPRSRNELWALLRELVSGGTSILLTTQYLDEADQLCDRILVIDRGRTIAEGTPAELKGQVGGERVQLSVADPDDLEEAALALAPFAGSSPEIDAERRLVTLPVSTSTSLLELVRALDSAGVEAADVTRRIPTLDDVFLTLTGCASADGDQVDDTEHQLAEEVLG